MATTFAAASSYQMNRIDIRNRAFKLLLEKSFERGEFKLASGKMSNYYLDVKPTMHDPEGSHALAALVLDRLVDTKVDLIGGLAVGAVSLVSNVTLMSYLSGRPLPSFYVRKEVKDHGTKRLIEGANSIAGKSVVILDDVTTTGESAMIAVWAAQESGATVTLVLSVVDRLEGAADFYKRQNIPFAHLFTADEFLRATEPCAASGP